MLFLIKHLCFGYGNAILILFHDRFWRFFNIWFKNWFLKLNSVAVLLLLSINIFVGVGNVQEIVFFVMFLIQRAHSGRCRGNHIVDEKEEGVLGPQVDAFADQKVELAYSQIGGYQVLLLVQITNACLGGLLYDDLKWNNWLHEHQGVRGTQGWPCNRSSDNVRWGETWSNLLCNLWKSDRLSQPSSTRILRYR